MRVLVTGAAGFVGSHYVRTMVSGGYPALGAADVTVYDALTPAANLENLAPAAGRFRLVQGDIGDAALLDEVLPGHDAVVNFASEGSLGAAEASEGADPLVPNVLGAATLFSACVRAGIARVVHVSTSEVYGDDRSGPARETDRLDPRTSWAASKAAGDLVARAVALECGLGLCVTRSPDDYGPYSGPSAPLPALLTAVLDGERPEPWARTRDWLHVDDHCRAVQLVLERGRPGEVYNIGGSAELSDAELLNRIVALTARRRSSPPATADRPARRLDDTAIRTLGYRPLVDFDEGLTATVQWYQDNESWWRPLREKLPGTAGTAGSASTAGTPTAAGESLPPSGRTGR